MHGNGRPKPRRNHARSSGSTQRMDWAGGLDLGVLQVIRSHLDDPYVPGALHLSRVCNTWHAAAVTPDPSEKIGITWDSRQLGGRPNLVPDTWGRSFRSWLLKAAPQLASFVVVDNGDPLDDITHLVYQALEARVAAAAAAGNPLPLQQLLLPVGARLEAPYSRTTSLVAALPHLRHLCLPVRTWEEGDNQPAWYGGPSEADVDSFLAALGSLQHLTSLEVTLVPGSGWQAPWDARPHWKALLEAAPKQLQHLAVRFRRWDRLPLTYTWEPLAALPHLKQLHLDAVWQQDLSPLAALPSLTSLGLQWVGNDWEPLVAVQEVLRDLEVGWVSPANRPHLQQLVKLTRLTLTNGDMPTPGIPQEVANGLQHLDWALWRDGGSRRGVQKLAGCSSSSLRHLQLRGSTWLEDGLAAEAVCSLTALTAFGLHAVRQGEAARSDLAPWRALLPMRHLKQLRHLALPAPLLATGGAWLGGLPHLTSLRLTMQWLDPWQVEEVFGSREAGRQALSNLSTCRGQLVVMEVEVTLFHKDGDPPVPEALVPGVRALLRRELPGVRLLLTWRVEWDAEEL